MTNYSDNNYFVWSHEHGAWWRPKRAGYTYHVSDAGIYTRQEALEICAYSRDGWSDEGRPPSEIPVRQTDVIECQTMFQKIMEKS